MNTDDKIPTKSKLTNTPINRIQIQISDDETQDEGDEMIAERLLDPSK